MEAVKKKKRIKDPFVDLTHVHFVPLPIEGLAQCTWLAPTLEACNTAFFTRTSHTMPTVLCSLTVLVVIFAHISSGIGWLSHLSLCTSISILFLPFPLYPLLLPTRPSTRGALNSTTRTSGDGVHQDATRHASWAVEEAG